MLRKLSWALVAFIAVSAVSWTADRPTAAHALSNCAVDDLTVDDEEQAFLRLINDYRARNNAPALTISPALTRAATWMAYDLSTRSGLAHSDSLGRSPWQRMPDCGYAIPGGENLAAGTNRSGAQWPSTRGCFGLHRDVMLANASLHRYRRATSKAPLGVVLVTDFGTGWTRHLRAHPLPQHRPPPPRHHPLP